ncbi:MAG TPA: hypothetical protein VFH20_04475, partial [Propionibacteriaceae bacterium]|nr:hypothetical protein [Propionibacteriaceae bacterium]
EPGHPSLRRLGHVVSLRHIGSVFLLLVSVCVSHQTGRDEHLIGAVFVTVENTSTPFRAHLD